MVKIKGIYLMTQGKKPVVEIVAGEGEDRKSIEFEVSEETLKKLAKELDEEIYDLPF